MAEGQSDTWYWDLWWKDGVKASCLEGAKGGYTGETERRWGEVFAALPKGSKVLDVCTGNGAVAAIAQRTSDQRQLGLDITAMDRAKIDPPRFVRGDKALKKITFLAERDVEDTGLPDAGYDIVTSQYGVEYADLDRALPELARLVAPGGRVCIATHAAEGTPARDAAREIELCHYLLDELGLFTATHKALDAMAMPLSGNRMPDAVARLRNLMGRLDVKRAELRGNAMLDNTWSVMNHALANAGSAGIAAVREKTVDVEAGVRSHLERSKALIDAAQSESQADAILTRLEKSGFDGLVLEPFEHLNPRRQVAWWISGRKSPGDA